MADLKAELQWQGEALRFKGGRSDGPVIAVDGDGREGPSPMSLLLLSLAGCMGADIVDIGTKMRLPITALAIEIEGDRRPDPPRHFTAIRMKVLVSGVAAADHGKVQRAVDLSRDTYCSVMHSLRDSVEIDIDVAIG
jgi:putative redox protein